MCPLWEFKDGNICPQSPWFTEVPLCWFSAVANYSFSEGLTLTRKTEFPFPEHQKETKYKKTWGDGVDLVSFSTSSCKMGKVTLWALYSPLHSAQMDDFSTQIHFYGWCHKGRSEFINLQNFLWDDLRKAEVYKGAQPIKRVEVVYGLISNSSLP